MTVSAQKVDDLHKELQLLEMRKAQILIELKTVQEADRTDKANLQEEYDQARADKQNESRQKRSTAANLENALKEARAS